MISFSCGGAAPLPVLPSVPARRSVVEVEGEGERTTEGMRWCLPLLGALLAGLSDEDAWPSTDSEDGEGEKVVLVGLGMGLEGSQLVPGLTMRLITSPSLMLYSLTSLLSARAFPLRRSLCASEGGAEGWELAS